MSKWLTANCGLSVWISAMGLAIVFGWLRELRCSVLMKRLAARTHVSYLDKEFPLSQPYGNPDGECNFDVECLGG